MSTRSYRAIPAVLGLLALTHAGSLAQGQEPPPPAAPEAEPRVAEPAPGEPNVEARLRERIDALEQRVRSMEQVREDEELEKLRQEGASAAAAQPQDKASKDRTFIAAGRSLQMLNPEISVNGDFLATVILNEDMYASADDRTDFSLREVGIHIQSSLDPFSLAKLSLCVTPEGGLELEEAYITWAGLLPGISVSLGQFRQPFGVVNRWHSHDLDQTGYPLALTSILGADGLEQTGLSVTWLMPALIAHTNELTLQVTDGANATLLAGERFSEPAYLARLKNYYDLSESTYLEIGLSGLAGVNHQRGVEDPDSGELVDEERRWTLVGGVDVTLHWQPLQQARYRSLTWRSEALWAQKDTPQGTKRRWGAYSYLQYQLAEEWFVGLRGDVAQPIELIEPETLWQVVPYVTFWQSEFVYLRLEAQHGDGFPHGRDTRLLFQIDFAMGPHKHARY